MYTLSAMLLCQLQFRDCVQGFWLFWKQVLQWQGSCWESWVSWAVTVLFCVRLQSYLEAVLEVVSWSNHTFIVQALNLVKTQMIHWWRRTVMLPLVLGASLSMLLQYPSTPLPVGLVFAVSIQSKALIFAASVEIPLAQGFYSEKHWSLIRGPAVSSGFRIQFWCSRIRI